MKNLEKVLKEMSAKGIEGVNNFEGVNLEMQCVSKFMSRVTLVYNDRFSLEYNHNVQKVELNTTYSNQVVDASFIEEMTILNKAKEDLNK